MTQLHTIHHGLGVARPTNDVDIVLHVETMRGVPNAVATALESLGYRFLPSFNGRKGSAHRFVRGSTAVDLVTGEPESQTEQVDVLIADHPAPRVIEKLRGHEMVQIEGGTPLWCTDPQGSRLHRRLPRPRAPPVRRCRTARVYRRPIRRADRVHWLGPSSHHHAGRSPHRGAPSVADLARRASDASSTDTGHPRRHSLEVGLRLPLAPRLAESALRVVPELPHLLGAPARGGDPCGPLDGRLS